MHSDLPPPPVSVGDPAPVLNIWFWSPYFLSTGNHVTTMQNAAARLISGARKWASISTRCSSACWCQVSVPCTRTLYGDLCFAVEETWVWNSLIAERHDPEIPLHMIGTPGPPSCIWDPASMYKWFGPPASVGDLAFIRDLASIRIYIIAYYDRPCISQQHIAVGAVLLNTALVAQTALVVESVLKSRSYCVAWTSPMISNNLGAVSQFPT